MYNFHVLMIKSKEEHYVFKARVAAAAATAATHNLSRTKLKPVYDEEIF